LLSISIISLSLKSLRRSS